MRLAATACSAVITVGMIMVPMTAHADTVKKDTTVRKAPVVRRVDDTRRARRANGQQAKSYPNCAALVLEWPHGVGTEHAKDRANGVPKATQPRFYRWTALYKINARLDRDKDHVACER